MNIDQLNKIYPDVYDELYNSTDYFYLAENYKYKTIEPDIIKYDANRFCDDMINAFVTYVPDSAPAEDYAHYIIACMTGAAAVDLFLDHLAQNHTKFNIKSWDGYIDEVVYDSSMPAKFHQSDSCVAGTLFASTATGVNAVNFQIIFTGYGGTDYKYLDQSICIKVMVPSTRQAFAFNCSVKDLNKNTFQECLDRVTW